MAESIRYASDQPQAISDGQNLPVGSPLLIAIGPARARQPRASRLKSGFSLNLSLAIGILRDRKWSYDDTVVVWQKVAVIPFLCL